MLTNRQVQRAKLILMEQFHSKINMMIDVMLKHENDMPMTPEQNVTYLHILLIYVYIPPNRGKSLDHPAHVLIKHTKPRCDEVSAEMQRDAEKLFLSCSKQDSQRLLKSGADK